MNNTSVSRSSLALVMVGAALGVLAPSRSADAQVRATILAGAEGGRGRGVVGTARLEGTFSLIPFVHFGV